MINKYNCIIVDDEPKAIAQLTQSITDLYTNLIISGTYTGWREALNALRQNETDIIFMDVSMPQKNAMDILAMVPDLKSEVIFITAHSDFALQAFDFSAAGYLLKPYKDALLVKAIDKALDRIKQKRLAEGNVANSISQPKRIGIPNHKGYDYVNMQDIVYMEAVKRYTKVVTNTETILSSYSIGNFKHILDPGYFCQVHRSYIVNLSCVKRYETSGTIILSNNVIIPVSKQQKEIFIKNFEILEHKKDIL